MIYTELTEKAMKLCFEKHKDQVDKNDIPYVFHPFHVAESMPDEITTCVALLHDIIEDTDVTAEYLKEQGFPEEIITAVETMTHSENVSYFDYIKRIKANRIASIVKISDLRHNMDISRLNPDLITDKDIARIEKYKTALTMLLEHDS